MTRFLPISRILALMLAVWAFSPGPAQALMLGFENITGNNADNAAIGEAQLSLDVTDTGAGGVSFEFGNAGPAQSTIAHIYFDDGLTLDASTLTIIGDTGVNFTLDGGAGNLPGGNSLDPKFNTALSVGANAPSPHEGVNPGESVTLRFASLNFETLVNAINSGLFRIGIHVRNFADGGSESFITGGDPETPQVPEPGTLLIFGLGMLGAVLLRRRRRGSVETPPSRHGP